MDLNEIKSRINPVYSYIRGTESHERKWLCDQIERLRKQLAECEEENKDIDADYEKVTKERDELLTIITQLRADIWEMKPVRAATKDKWHEGFFMGMVEFPWNICAEDGRVVAVAKREEDRARIVDCVNACKHISTESLKSAEVADAWLDKQEPGVAACDHLTFARKVWAAAQQAEREACAALAEDTAAGRDAEAIAEAIRARLSAGTVMQED